MIILCVFLFTFQFIAVELRDMGQSDVTTAVPQLDDDTVVAPQSAVGDLLPSSSCTLDLGANHSQTLAASKTFPNHPLTIINHHKIIPPLVFDTMMEAEPQCDAAAVPPTAAAMVDAVIRGHSSDAEELCSTSSILAALDGVADQLVESQLMEEGEDCMDQLTRANGLPPPIHIAAADNGGALQPESNGIHPPPAQQSSSSLLDSTSNDTTVASSANGMVVCVRGIVVVVISGPKYTIRELFLEISFVFFPDHQYFRRFRVISFGSVPTDPDKFSRILQLLCFGMITHTKRDRKGVGHRQLFHNYLKFNQQS